MAINNGGTVAGWSSTLAGVEHAYRWHNGTMEDLGALGGGFPESKALAINDRGRIVGVSVPEPFSDFVGRATMWDPGAEPLDLGSLHEGGNSRAFAVNNQGVIAGWSDTPSGEFHVVLWRP